MHRTNLLILAFSLGTQARVLDRQASSSATTTSTSIVSPPSSTPTVIAGSCGQDTLQYCCPFVTPTEGESSVDFASACRDGNLPASFDCFFAFQDICCSGNSDENGDSCEIVLPDRDICAAGAAGSISSLGAVAGASTVTETVDCTATSTSTSSVAATTTSPPSSTSTPSPPISTPTSSSTTASDPAPTITVPPSLHRKDSVGWIGALGLSQKLNYQSQYSNVVQSIAWDLGKEVVGCEMFDSGLVCGWEWKVVETIGDPNLGPINLKTDVYGINGGGGKWIETPVTKIT